MIEPGLYPLRVRFCPEAMVAPPLKVARPVTPRVEERVVAPVTPRVVPTVAEVVIEALFRVASPAVERVEREELPVTPRVPPRVVAPVPTVKVFAPVTEVLPLRVTPPVPVEKVVAPVWEMFPDVERSPRLSMVKYGVLPFSMLRAVLVEPEVLLMINELAEPALVRVKEVGVAKLPARLNAMLLPEVVVIELPPLYADCRVIDEELHWVTSFEPLTQIGVPVALVRPLSVKKLEPVVLMVTLLPAVGVKTELPLAWKVF